MRKSITVLSLLLGLVTPALSQLSFSINLPGASIGINVPVYPQLVRVPNYPVYYAPALQANFFFYDGMYWVFQGDQWYASAWYDGPWGRVGPEAVPLFILRIPVRYYRSPPPYFGGWPADAPPRWGEHWGHDWQRQRSGWDQWNHRAMPAPAPLPVYQRKYTADRYPGQAQQQALHDRNYAYRPREDLVRQHYDAQAAHRPPAPSPQAQRGAEADQRPAVGRSAPEPRATVVQPPKRQPQPAAAPHEPPGKAAQHQDRDRGDKGDKGNRGDKGDDRGPEHRK